MMSELLAVEDVMAELRIGRDLLWRLFASGEIPSFKVGRRRLVTREDLRRFIEAERERQMAERGQA